MRYSSRKKSFNNKVELNDSIENYVIYDYETYGLDVKTTGISQLAAVRLNKDAQEFPAGEFNLEVSAYHDQIMGPIAAIKTGFKISPLVNAQGEVYNYELLGRVRGRKKVPEVELAYAWYTYITSQRNTCILGYNNFSFDDRVTSHLFFRNFIHPYQWYFENNNSRMDLFHLAIAFSTICPKAINWPINPETGNISYKLEEISRANRFSHLNAHDAMSDVKACVQLMQAFHADRIELDRFTPEEQANLYEINVSPESCFKHLAQFRSKFKVIQYVEAKGKSILVYFDINGRKRATRHATPVVCLNNFVGNKIEREILLLDLTVPHENFREFLTWDSKDLQDYFNLSSKYRKFSSPLLVAESNRFPLFASLNECSLNREINTPEVKQNVQTNYQLLEDLAVEELNVFYANLLQASKERFNAATPDSDTSVKVYTQVETEKEEVKYSLNKLNFSHKERDKVASQDNQIRFYPESFLTKNFNIINDNKVLFNGKLGPNLERFTPYLMGISADPVLNSLFTLFKGNVDFYNLPPRIKKEYLAKLETRLDVAKEAFENGMVELRRQFSEDKDKFLQEYNLREIQELGKNTEDFYQYTKKFIQEFLEETSEE
ncbi:hypothetical protein CKF54_07780 [Psittacicella hinzii]|uniref:Uncharacterized protein n=1 Tax=Psittacicella hinzii TaxID=2028575 RepID=A0A3A1Y0V4_9GAMM|nr:hypothetical protein [Psittacicella hinzii]RIY31081.1 hypothetical protein CKF54_07780 [Psittacicella hinzii]